MIFKNSKLILTVASFVFFALSAVIIFGIYDIKAKNKKTSELLNEADRLAEAENLTQSIKMIQASVAADLTALDNLVLVNDKLVPLIESVEEAGQELGLDTDIISVEKIVDKKSVEPDIIRIVTETRGPWAPTLSFLRAIESLPHRVTISDASFSKVETNWRSRIVLTLYSFD